MDGDLGDVLDELGHRGVLQLMIEGGANVAHDFHHAGLVDRYVIYLAPRCSVATMRGRCSSATEHRRSMRWHRGRIVDVQRLGDDSHRFRTATRMIGAR